MTENADKIIKDLLGRLTPCCVTKVKVVEEVSRQIDDCLVDILITLELIKSSKTTEERDKYVDKYKHLMVKHLSIMQFMVQTYAPNEYKELMNPPPATYNQQMQEIVFRVAETEYFTLINDIKKIGLNYLKGFLNGKGQENTQASTENRSEGGNTQDWQTIKCRSEVGRSENEAGGDDGPGGSACPNKKGS